MKQYLSESVNSFGTQTKKSIYSILSEVSQEKNEIGRLVEKLTSFTSAADYAPRVIRQLEPVQKEFIIDMFRDIDLRIKTQFNASNSLSILSSSMRNIFGGELEKIEKDLQYLKGYIDDWSFVSGEDDLYNSSFVENFDNESNSFLNDKASFLVPDRDGVPLDTTMVAKVDPITGKLRYSSNYELSLFSLDQSQIKSISYETNFSKEYISSDTGVEKILNNLDSKPWNLTIKAPFVLKESLLDSEKYKDFKNNINVGPSAQVALNLEFNTAVMVSRLRLNPNTIDSLGIAQIIIETENTNNASQSTNPYKKIGILSAPIFIQKNYDIEFDNTYSIKSLTIIFFQREYSRTKISSIQSEINSKMISSIYKEIKNSRKDQHDTLQDFVIRFFLRETDKLFILRNNKVYNYNYTSYYPKSLSKTNFGVVEKLSSNKYFSDLDAFNKFKNTSLLSNIVFSIISYSLGSKLRNKVISTYVESNIKQTPKGVSSFLTSGIMPVADSNNVDKNIHYYNNTFGSISQNDATELLNSIEQINLYEYAISIAGISLYTKTSTSINRQKKSFFLSKKISTDGRPLKVKMLAKYFDEIDYLSQSPSSDQTSVEYSITTKENPSSESDWVPIMPYDETSIRSEVLFPNSSGECVLRFEPFLESVVLYENSIERVSNSYSTNIKNLKIDNYNPLAKYFVSYRPKYAAANQEIFLNPESLSVPILVTPSSNGSNGEYFSSASQSNRVRLSYSPHIDQSRFIGASYSSYVGTVTSYNSSYGNYDNSSYSPVKVIFADGTPAINITNYITNNNQIESFYETDAVLFLHYADSIVFNQPINKPFRVLYQYIPDSFRYRVILRSITDSDQNYSVDRLIFKFSTEKRDNMLINLVKYDNLFKNKLN